MDQNLANVAIAVITMITSIVTVYISHRTNRRTRRIEHKQEATHQALVRIWTHDDKKPLDKPEPPLYIPNSP